MVISRHKIGPECDYTTETPGSRSQVGAAAGKACFWRLSRVLANIGRQRGDPGGPLGADGGLSGRGGTLFPDRAAGGTGEDG